MTADTHGKPGPPPDAPQQPGDFAEHHRVSFEYSPVPLQFLDQEGRILDINQAWFEMLGYSRDETLGRWFGDFVSETNLIDFRTFHSAQSGVGSVTAVPIRLVRKDGTKVDVEARYQAVRNEEGGPVRFCCAIHDVTDLVRARERIRYQSGILNNVSDAIIAVDMNFTVTSWNKAAEQMYGWTAQEVLNRPLAEFTRPRIPGGSTKQVFQKLLADGFYRGEILHQRKDGTKVRVQKTASLTRDDRGYPAGVVSIDRDIEAVRRAEEAARGERYLSRTLLDIVTVAVVALDTEGNVTLVNRHASRILGYPEKRIVGLNWFDNFLPPSIREEARTTHRILLSETVESGNERFESTVLNRDGEERIVYWHNTEIRDAEGRITGTLSAGTDITELRRAHLERNRIERQMQNTQKLESLGILAAGIAHDFNNLLTAILGNIDLALEDIPFDSAGYGPLASAGESAQRAADLCNLLLAYAGRGRAVEAPVDLSRVVSEMTGLLEVSVAKTTVLRTELATDLPSIVADVTQIRQVVMNLITNASEALNGTPGTITVRTRVENLDSEHLSSACVDDRPPAGRYVLLEVSDTGRGMDSEVVRKLFDPFYSTKSEGRGLGLGAVLGIVRNHGGTIKVDSQPGSGSTFIVILPVARNDTPPAEPDRPPEAPPGWKTTGTVLFVDDEESLRDLGGKILRRTGMSVLTAANGRDAIALFQTKTAEIDCVVLDLTMPEMGGEETYRLIRKTDPNVPVIVTSGFTESDLLRRFEDDLPTGILTKPFRAGDLVAALRRVHRR